MVAFSSKNGLFTPGTINAKGDFAQSNQFISEKGKVKITLKTTYQAGDDVITLQIPGASDIHIPVTVIPGTPYKTDFSLATTTLQPGETQQVTTQVFDHWGNQITPLPASLKVGTM